MKGLENLIPMSDDEKEVGDEPIERQIIAPNVCDNTLMIGSPMKSFIGDFTDNSFIYNGDEIINIGRMNLDNKCRELEAPAVIPYADRESNVYMEAAVDLFQKLNIKVEKLMQQKSREGLIVEECYKRLLLNDIRGAMLLLRPCTDARVGNTETVLAFIGREWPEFIHSVKDDFIKMKDATHRIKCVLSSIVDRASRKMEECERLKGIINRQNTEHTAQMDTLVSENNSLKEGLIEILGAFGPKNALDSRLETDLLSNIRALLARQAAKIAELKEREHEKDAAIEGFREQAASYEVGSLRQQIEDYRQMQKRLQAENLNFSGVIQKLSEKNIKYKQDLVLFNSELKRSIEALKVKTETIARQKTLISLFQDKLGGSNEYPLEELRRKKKELESKLENENDYFVKQQLRKEKVDCERRLSDFNSLQQQK